MAVALSVRNVSAHKGCYKKAALRNLARRVCDGEGVPGDVEVSVLFCGDAAIRKLNADYAGKDEATDVLSFEQAGIHADTGPRALGDIVISLDTVQSRCDGDADGMRHEVQLLFCHGLLHLIGFDHGDARGRRTMIEKQAAYLRCTRRDAWFRAH